jgi:2-dehydropantoate 2-reductase
MKEVGMKVDNARILVIGAGVNGSICAAALQNAGIDVTVLARGERYAEIQNNGIIIENSLTHERSITKVSAIHVLEPDDSYDYILVIIRQDQMAALLPALAGNRSANIVFMANNLLGGEAYTAIGKERIMLGFVFGGGKREGPVVYGISNVGGVLGALFGGIPFGEMDGAVTERLKRLVAVFRQGGLDARVSRRVADYLATHAGFVTLMVGLGIKYDMNLQELARAKADLGLMVDGLREWFKVLGALGYQVTPPKFRILEAVPRSLMAAGLGAFIGSDMMKLGMTDWSMSQTRMEWDHFGQELERIVDKSSLAVPAIRRLLAYYQWKK